MKNRGDKTANKKNKHATAADTDAAEKARLTQQRKDTSTQELLEGEGEKAENAPEIDTETMENHFPVTGSDKPEDPHSVSGCDDLPPEDNEDTFSKKTDR
jgi:hypothetical protein